MNTEVSDAIDRQHLSAIAMGSEEVILPILENFRESFREELRNLSAAGSEVTGEIWKEFYHRIKGTGGTLGLAEVFRECERFEERLREGILPSEDDLAAFRSLMESSCEQAVYYLKSLATAG